MKAANNLQLGVRSEDIRIGPGQPAEASIFGVENHGVEKIVTLRVDNQFLKATAPVTLKTEIDARVKFGFDPAKLHLFDATSGINLG